MNYSPVAMLSTGAIGYEERGDGEAVLLIHGSGIAVTSFVPLMKEPVLADRFRLIRYHRRGYSESASLSGEDKLSGQDYADLQAKDAVAVLRHAGVHRTHVVGHSSGGWIAVQLAMREPDIVHSLTLMEPAIYAIEPSWTPMMLEFLKPLYELYDRDPDAAAEMLAENGEGKDWRSFADTLPGGAEQWVRDTKAMIFEFRIVQDWTFGANEASRITQPVLYMTGGNSISFMEDVKALFCSRVPQTEGVVIPNEGHMMFTQRPARAAREIATFLERHPMT